MSKKQDVLKVVENMSKNQIDETLAMYAAKPQHLMNPQNGAHAAQNAEMYELVKDAQAAKILNERFGFSADNAATFVTSK